MAKRVRRVVLPASAKKPMPGAKSAGRIDGGERIEVTVRVRPRRPLPAVAVGRLSHDEFRKRFGASPADVTAVERFAAEHGLDVASVSLSQRSIVLAGTVAAMQDAFGVALASYRKGKVTFRGRTGAIRLPQRLAPLVEGVFGLDDRPQTRPHFRRRESRGRLAARATAGRPLTPLEVASAYGFPANRDGSGQCIALIELGGGFRAKDLTTYWRSLGIAPAVSVSAISISGAHNAPGSDADGEVMLDIEVAGAVAPRARIAVYFAPNTDDGFLTAVRAAVHDSIRKPSVLSISWGGPEEAWTAQALRDFDAACREAALLGVTICCAAGDHGSSDVDPVDARVRADFPASSPAVLACGGTRLDVTGGKVKSEVVWNEHDGWATGGGVSSSFRLPTYQIGKGVPRSAAPGGRSGRGIPDVAGNADSRTGYKVRVDGANTVIGGTSAVAPLWAGLVALLNQGRKKPLGFVNPKLYALAASAHALRDITSGDNGAYAAKPGWDACTGLGVPNGRSLARVL